MTLGAALPVPRRLYLRASPLLRARGSGLCFSRGYSQPSGKVGRTSFRSLSDVPHHCPAPSLSWGGFLLLVSQVQRPEHQCSQIDSIHFAQHGSENAAPRALQDPLPWIYLPLSRIDIFSLLSHHSPVTGSSYKMSVARGCF